MAYELIYPDEPLFPGLNVHGIQASVAAGLRPEQPDQNHDKSNNDKELIDKIYNLCQECWSHEASKRPTFEEVVEKLNEI